MISHISVLLVPILLLSFHSLSSHGADTPVIVKTKSGPIRGFKRSVEGRTVNHFLGIPYALPPIGRRRYVKPTPISPWKAVRNVTELSPTCWQYIASDFERNTPGTAVWVNNTAMSEDCLYLNVWAPTWKAGQPKKAVMIWIFGGGFMSGSANLEIYNGAVMAASQDVIVANLQYRIGTFGFLYLPSAVDSNAGLYDQRLAMQWIVKNLDSFNGDPNRVTLVGESAGAASVSMHLLSTLSRGLFQRAILHSASFLSPWAFSSPARQRKRSRTFATKLNCLTSDSRRADTVSDADILACLRNVPAERLNELTYSAVAMEPTERGAALSARLGIPRGTKPKKYVYDISFVPVPEPPFFQFNGSEAMAEKKMKSASLLMGTNLNEGTYFFLYILPFLAENFYNGKKSRLVEWPKRLADLKVNATTITDLIGRHILPIDYMSKSIVDALAMQYDFPLPLSGKISAVEESSLSNMAAKGMDNMAGDLNFKCPVYNLAEWYARQGAKVYMYSFEHRTGRLSMPKWLGVMHGYELDYLFGMPMNNAFKRRFYNYTPAETELSKEMMRRWTNFAKTGDPNKGKVTVTESIVWPTFNERTAETLRLSINPAGTKVEVKIGKSDKVKDCRFWDLVVKQLAKKEKLCPTPPSTPASSSSGLWSTTGFLPLVLSSFVGVLFAL